MKNDIIERLLDDRDDEDCDCCRCDGAKEIQRLRAKVADLTQRLHWANQEMLRRG